MKFNQLNLIILAVLCTHLIYGLRFVRKLKLKRNGATPELVDFADLDFDKEERELNENKARKSTRGGRRRTVTTRIEKLKFAVPVDDDDSSNDDVLYEDNDSDLPKLNFKALTKRIRQRNPDLIQDPKSNSKPKTKTKFQTKTKSRNDGLESKSRGRRTKNPTFEQQVDELGKQFNQEKQPEQILDFDFGVNDEVKGDNGAEINFNSPIQTVPLTEDQVNDENTDKDSNNPNPKTRQIIDDTSNSNDVGVKLNSPLETINDNNNNNEDIINLNLGKLVNLDLGLEERDKVDPTVIETILNNDANESKQTGIKFNVDINNENEQNPITEPNANTSDNNSKSSTDEVTDTNTDKNIVGPDSNLKIGSNQGSNSKPIDIRDVNDNGIDDKLEIDTIKELKTNLNLLNTNSNSGTSSDKNSLIKSNGPSQPKDVSESELSTEVVKDSFVDENVDDKTVTKLLEDTAKDDVDINKSDNKNTKSELDLNRTNNENPSQTQVNSKSSEADKPIDTNFKENTSTNTNQPTKIIESNPTQPTTINNNNNNNNVDGSELSNRKLNLNKQPVDSQTQTNTKINGDNKAAKTPNIDTKSNTSKSKITNMKKDDDNDYINYS